MAAGRTAKGAGIAARPQSLPDIVLGVQDSHDLIGVRIDDHDLVLDQDVAIGPPFRINRHDAGRQGVQLDALARNAGADRNREVHVGHRTHVLLADHRGDLRALLGRELGAGAGLADSRVGAALTLRVLDGAGAGLALRVLVGAGAGLALSVLVGARVGTLLVLGIVGAAGAALGALSLHVLLVLGAGLARVLARVLTHALGLVLLTLR